jgi:hypothetical protein
MENGNGNSPGAVFADAIMKRVDREVEKRVKAALEKLLVPKGASFKVSFKRPHSVSVSMASYFITIKAGRIIIKGIIDGKRSIYDEVIPELTTVDMELEIGEDSIQFIQVPERPAPVEETGFIRDDDKENWMHDSF